MRWKPTDRQLDAWDCLMDKTTTEIFFGGAAGPGKSTLGCMWLLYICQTYPGARCLMGRAILKTLKESTLLTMFDILAKNDMKKDADYSYHPMEGLIKFPNGSQIHLKDLFAYPSDPEFDELGSTEYTCAFIDEGSQITSKAKNICMSRIRYRLDEFKLIPKLLIASNPCKTFLYYEFYKPWKDGTLEPYRKMITALVSDNPHISPHYIENLKKLDKNSRERLLYGNWEYDEDPARLFEFDAITDIFTNRGEETEDQFLSCDIARYGSDRCVIKRWRGLRIASIIHFRHSSVPDTAAQIEKIAGENGIRRSHIVADDDGVGGGVVDMLKGIVGFVNNSKPIEARDGKKENYANLKSQCYFKLAEYVAAGRIGCYKEVPQDVKEMLTEDLEQIKRKGADKDGPLCIIGKEEIKEHLGRSPDFADAMMMRMYFELKKSSPISIMGWGDNSPGPAPATEADMRFSSFLHSR